MLGTIILLRLDIHSIGVIYTVNTITVYVHVRCEVMCIFKAFLFIRNSGIVDFNLIIVIINKANF